jgi:hypothetical protein
MARQLGEQEFTGDAQYAVEDAIVNQGIDATTHIEGKKSGRNHRVWVVKNADVIKPTPAAPEGAEGVTRDTVRDILRSHPDNAQRSDEQLDELIASENFQRIWVRPEANLGVSSKKTGESLAENLGKPIILDENELGWYRPRSEEGPYGSAPYIIVLDGQNRLIAARKSRQEWIPALIGDKAEKLLHKYPGLFSETKPTPAAPEGAEGVAKRIDDAFLRNDIEALEDILDTRGLLTPEQRDKAQEIWHEMARRKVQAKATPAAPEVKPVKAPVKKKPLKPLTVQEKQVLLERGFESKEISLKEAREILAEPPKPRRPRTAGFLGMPVELPEPEVAREVAEKIYQDTINRFASIENAVKKAKALGMDIQAGEDAGMRARSYLGLGRKVEVTLEKSTFRTTKEGNVEKTGEGLKPILDSYENKIKTLEPSRQKREQDFNDFLVATRTVEDLQRKAYEGAKANIATEKQVAESKARLAKLETDYGEKGMAVFQEHAERLYEYQKRVLHLLVDAGNISQKQFDHIIELNQHYIPFDRVIEQDMIGGVPVSKDRFTKARAPISRIKGSELEIEDTIQSVIKNTYKIMAAAERNTVAANIAKLSHVLPDKISPIRVKIIPIKVDPKEILTTVKEFKTESRKIMEEVRTLEEAGGTVELSGPASKLEKVVRDALTNRGFSEGEARSFVTQIKKGEAAEGVTKETLKQTIKETQQLIIKEEPIESIIFRPSQFAPKGKVIEYFANGKRKYVELSGNLFNAMTGLDEVGASALVRILSKPAHWLRVGATITPEFMARNPIRDQWTALMQTSFGFTPFYDSAGAIADILHKNEAYQEWLASGGAYSGFVELNRPALEKAVKELRGHKSLLSKLNIISHAQDLSQLMEMATRLGAFKAAKQAGKTSVEAGFESREASIDFARRGAKLGDVNRTIAFLNAQIQGLDKTIRTVINRPYQTIIKGALAITLPSLLLYLRNRKEEDYRELASWKKDLFWNFKIGDRWWRVPKPFLFGQLFGSIPERFMEFLDTKDPESFDDIMKSVAEGISPFGADPVTGLLPTAIRPVLETAFNENFFLDRPIIPESRVDLLPPEQFTRYTTDTAKQLGRWTNYSPAKIENLVRGYFGGTGQYALQGTDILANGIRRAAGEKAIPKRPRQLADIPLLKGFVHRPPTGSQAKSVNDFYESSEVIINGWNTIQSMKKERRMTEVQGLQIRKLDDQKLAIAKRANDMIRKAQEMAQ